MMQVNPMQLIQMIRDGKNPQQLMINILEQQMGSTPMGENLLMLMKDNKTGDIEQIARNVCKSRGIDFDKEFPAFKRSLGIR